MTTQHNPDKPCDVCDVCDFGTWWHDPSDSCTGLKATAQDVLLMVKEWTAEDWQEHACVDPEADDQVNRFGGYVDVERVYNAHGEEYVGVRLSIQLDGFSLFLDTSLCSIYVFGIDGTGAREFGTTSVMDQVVGNVVDANW